MTTTKHGSTAPRAPRHTGRGFIARSWIADAMAKWLPPNGFTGKVHQIDAKVGGTYRKVVH
jgi:hypothetical protein